MKNLIVKNTKIVFYYMAYDINYKHELLNSVTYTWSGCGKLQDYINSMINLLHELHKDVIQYSVYECTEKLLKCVSIDKGVETDEI